MLLTSRVRARVQRRRLIAAALATAAVTAGVVVTAPDASAATIGKQAVSEASRHSGQPCVYGAAGPTKFDCSGFTLYVFSRMGKRLPHNSTPQYNAPGVRHVSSASKSSGDLIFMRNSSGRITHVGIYAGSNRWWVSPNNGDHVTLQSLYSSNFAVGRVT